MSNDGAVEFCGTMKFETEKAYLVTDGVDEFWIVKSMVISMRQIRGSDYEFLVPHWLAKEKGII